MGVPDRTHEPDVSPCISALPANGTSTSDSATSHSLANSTISAIQETYETQLDGLPNYTETDQNGGIQATIRKLSAAASANDLDLPITACPPIPLNGYSLHTDTVHSLRQNIVSSFFDAVTTKKDEAVALMIKHNLVTANTTSATGQTPLLAAISAGNAHMVRELVNRGADINGYGVYILPAPNPNPRDYHNRYYHIRKAPKLRQLVQRTPLQLAAALGNLTIVKLLMRDTYTADGTLIAAADDALIAPDGALALRLAADAGHRDIVAFLPARRGGGWRRWKTRHATAMARARRAGEKLWRVGRFFGWDAPKFALWTLPVECVRALVWAWERRAKFGAWCVRQVVRLPGRVARVLRALWDVVEQVPGAVLDVLKFFWRVVKSVPAALKIAAGWVWRGVSVVGYGVVSVVGRLLSFLHTVFAKLLRVVRGLTLKDVWDGFRALLCTMFVEVPLTLWTWAKQFGKVSFKCLETLLGIVGALIWAIVRGIFWLIVYAPKKALVIPLSFGESINKAFVELLVWINPKR
ncbi:hypothetical protein AOQ84DRAFT_390142 [Glonium stellatum]|uniref:Ankyrin n=1 Tax=Glonium stellatum TaxID=574774 RepID=A0A8E2EX42_9PEZI|nr:hypothetical protein AOQ84DRAFT_390142 [Glonium stellatum]